MRCATYSIIACFLSCGAQADSAQTNLADQIRKESESHSIYLGDETHSYLAIIGCEARAEFVQKASEGTQIYGYRFELNRTRLPEIPAQDVENFGVVDLGVEGKFGMLPFEFISPHLGEAYGDVPSFWPWAPVSGLEFTMKELTDMEQPRQVLTLLKKYQDEYCIFLG